MTPNCPLPEGRVPRGPNQLTSEQKESLRGSESRLQAAKRTTTSDSEISQFDQPQTRSENQPSMNPHLLPILTTICSQLLSEPNEFLPGSESRLQAAKRTTTYDSEMCQFDKL